MLRTIRGITTTLCPNSIASFKIRKHDLSVALFHELEPHDVGQVRQCVAHSPLGGTGIRRAPFSTLEVISNCCSEQAECAIRAAAVAVVAALRFQRHGL